MLYLFFLVIYAYDWCDEKWESQISIELPISAELLISQSFRTTINTSMSIQRMIKFHSSAGIRLLLPVKRLITENYLPR